MTCRQMGGPCDMPIHGETAEEMSRNGAAHLQEQNDEEHKQVMGMMQSTQSDPAVKKQWDDEFARKFAELPED